MKKMTDFIVEKRNIILALFLVLAGVSCILSNRVTINYDIAKYLPSSSETRIGMDIMEEEFGTSDESTLNVMLKDLNDDEKTEIYHYLENLSDVKKVDYDKTDEYNKDDYALYILTIDGNADSATAKEVYEKIEDDFKDEQLATSGDVSERNKTVLAPWIIALAILCALIILIIMCESYVEPFLFLGTIGIAILLNSGTNIMFESVSNITNSISAILQLALSMDYSIMLMNRYQQEKKTEKNKEKAMKNALCHAFASISSSSVTTIVGLIALVFMSFTIGRDLGFVLAKGVLFSLLAIFTCLPALILLCDKWIVKTRKKSPVIKLDLLGKLAHKTRYIAIFLLLLVFGLSYAMKGNLGILYTDSETDEVAKVFPVNNQIALLYKNEREQIISEYCKTLENEDKIDTVLCYGNTINESFTYDKLNAKLKDLGSAVDIDTYLLKIIYYNYYVGDVNNKMSFEEFVKFMKNEVYKNEDLEDFFDESMKKNIDKLEYFTNTKAMNAKRSSSEIANILGIEESKVKDILIYYNSLNTTTTLSIGEFISFMNNYVLKDEKYGALVNTEAKNNLNKISKFINKNTIQKKMTASEMAKLFGMDEKIINSIYTYYAGLNGESLLTIAEFSSFVDKNILTNDDYKNVLTEDIKAKVSTLVMFSDKNVITKEMDSKELSQTFNMSEDVVKGILLLNYKTKDNGTLLSMREFVESTLYIKNTTNYLDGVDASSLEALQQNDAVMNNPTKYTATELSNVLGLNREEVYALYGLIDFANGNTTNWTMSPEGFVRFILENRSNPAIAESLSKETEANLQLLQIIMASTLSDAKYDFSAMAKLMGVDESTVAMIYGLSISHEANTTLTPQEFVNFLLDHKKDEVFAGNLDETTLNDLIMLDGIMEGVVGNEKYTHKGLAKLLGINSDSLSLIYSLYDSTKKTITISLKDVVNFILDDVMNDKAYANSFDETSKEALRTINSIMTATQKNQKFTENEMYKTLHVFSKELDENMIELLYIYYGSENDYDTSWTMTIEEFVKYLNGDILNDERFEDFIDEDKEKSIQDSKNLIADAKKLLVGKDYSRVVINTKFDPESKETFDFIEQLKTDVKGKVGDDFYVIGNSPMAYEMSQTFEGELNFITILTMVFIFTVVAFTFKSLIIPFILVFLIQCAVYLTMGILSFAGGTVYFIALLIVQSILMGATIDYAILYTSYYLESRETMNVKEAIINSYNKSIHTILTSASILIIATLIIGHLATAIAAKICKTLSQGTLCSALLILILLPAVLGACDRFIIKNKKR